MSDFRQSDLWVSFMKDLGWSDLHIGSGQHAFKKNLGFLGSIVKISRLEPPFDFKKIDHLAKNHRALFVKLEPQANEKDTNLKNLLLQAGYWQDRWSLQPTKTIVVNLKPAQEEILTSFEKDTRNCVRAAEKRGVQVEKSQDINLFWELYSQTAKRGHFWARREEIESLWRTFQDQACILIAKYQEQPLAASLLVFHDKIGYYYHAGSLSQQRQLYATYAVVWQSILESKERGCESFDFVGVTDPRIPSTKSWSGFSHFKRGFGGQEVTYLGSFVKVYNPFLRPLFWLARFF